MVHRWNVDNSKIMEIFHGQLKQHQHNGVRQHNTVEEMMVIRLFGVKMNSILIANYLKTLYMIMVPMWTMCRKQEHISSAGSVFIRL